MTADQNPIYQVRGVKIKTKVYTISFLIGPLAKKYVDILSSSKRLWQSSQLLGEKKT